MTTLLVFDDSDAARDGLRAACAEAAPEERLVIMAPVMVPASLPVNVSAGDIWRSVCRAEVRLHHARALADALSADATRCAFARIHARDLAGAVVCGANRYHADTILIARPTVFWRRFRCGIGPYQRSCDRRHVRSASSMARDRRAMPRPCPPSRACTPVYCDQSPSMRTSGIRTRIRPGRR